MKIKILFAGLGGVGGFYGGLISRLCENNPDIDVYFLARGEHLQKIKENGLKVITEDGTFITRPTLATDDASEIGPMNYIIISTKSYDLGSTIEQLKPCISNQTILLPLLNGADITPRIRKILPENEIWHGNVYIVGRLIEPGVVESSGHIHNLYFGHEKVHSEQLEWMEKLMIDAGIKATLSKDIRKAIWRKFFFISSTATLTSYYNCGFSDLANHGEKRELFVIILEELLKVATAEKIEFDEDMIDSALKHCERLPKGSTSSMNSDFMAGRKTELETLTGIVIQMAVKHHIPVPTYQKIYDILKTRLKQK